MLQVRRQDVGGVGPEIGTEIFPHFGTREFMHVFAKLMPGIAPCKVRVRLMEAAFGQPLHHVRPGKGLGEEDHVGEIFPDRADHLVPKRERFGVRIVDAKDTDPLLKPVDKDVLQFFFQILIIITVKVDRIDVFILLRRILGVLDGLVRAPFEPLRMLLHVRVVRRALKSDVEGYLDAVLGSRRHKILEVLERTQLRVDRLVAAVGVADRPRAARVRYSGGQAVVAALAVRGTDRMNRRKVKHIESHSREFRQQPLTILERTVLSLCEAPGTRKEFIPGAVQRTLPVDAHGQFMREAAVRLALAETLHQIKERPAHPDVRTGEHVPLPGKIPSPFLEPASILQRTVDVDGRRVEQLGGDLHLQPHILAGLPQLDQFAAPGGELVNPARHRVYIVFLVLDKKIGGPQVIDPPAHRNLAPLSFAPAADEQYRLNVVMGVRIDRGGDGDIFSGHTFDGKGPAVDLGLNIFYDNTLQHRDGRGLAAGSFLGCLGRHIPVLLGYHPWVLAVVIVWYWQGQAPAVSRAKF